MFSFCALRALASLSFESALPCSGRCWACANASLVPDGARFHIPVLPAWGNTPGCSAPLVFWRALGQSAQAEQDTLILYREFVVASINISHLRMSCTNEDTFDVAVIGGGVVGCGVLRGLTLAGFKAVLIEKEDAIAAGWASGKQLFHWEGCYLCAPHHPLLTLPPTSPQGAIPESHALRRTATLERSNTSSLRCGPLVIPCDRRALAAVWTINAQWTRSCRRHALGPSPPPNRPVQSGWMTYQEAAALNLPFYERMGVPHKATGSVYTAWSEAEAAGPLAAMAARHGKAGATLLTGQAAVEAIAQGALGGDQGPVRGSPRPLGVRACSAAILTSPPPLLHLSRRRRGSTCGTR